MATLSSRNAEAVFWVTAATGLFSLVFASGKFAGGIASPLQILFLRYVGGLITLLAALAVRRDGLRRHRSTVWPSHLLRAAFGAYGGVALIYATANMPVVDASAIGLMQVAFMVALGMILFGDRIGLKHWFGILLCAAGAVLIVGSRGAFRTFDTAYLLPAAVALFGALFVALESILIKTLSRGDTAMSLLLHVNAFGIVLLAMPAFATWQSTAFIDTIPFLLLGPLAISAQYMVVRGYRLADISVVAPVDFSWLVFAALIGWLAFAEVPSIEVLLGSGVIAAGGIVLATVK